MKLLWALYKYFMLLIFERTVPPSTALNFVLLFGYALREDWNISLSLCSLEGFLLLGPFIVFLLLVTALFSPPMSL